MAATLDQPRPRSTSMTQAMAWSARPVSARAQAVRNAVPPIVLFIVVVALWQTACTVLKVPKFLLPKPTDVVAAAIDKADVLETAVLSTFTSALIALSLAIVIGMTAALIMSQTKMLERTLYPYAIILQTIPIIAIAPLIVIWVGAGMPAVVIIAFLVALFPIITNTTAGLTSTDHNLVSMFELYNANWLQRTVKLKLPAAMPYIMTGLRISAGLAVLGAVIGEFIAGIGGLKGGLGYVIQSAMARLEMGYLFAAALCSCTLSLSIFVVVSLVSSRSLRHWHESAVKREN